jgi:PPOX class probable F420-dependent enzyme
MDEPPAWVTAALRDERVARLGTADDGGAVRLVPVCFAVVDGWLASVVDHKPKRTGQLRRLDDMRAAGRGTVLVDHYEDDWSRLWWVRLRGVARIVEDPRAVELLAAKYPQYREQPPAGPVIVVSVEERSEWTASPS